MGIRELRTFLALADTLNYQKASERLGYAPSTLSHHIKTLEQELGVALFVKVGKQIQMTAEASAFMDHARNLIVSYEAALASVGTGSSEQENISIGGCESTICNGLIDLFASFAESRSSIRLRQRTSANAQVPEMIREKHADVGIFYSMDTQRLQGLQDQCLFREPMRLVAARDSSISGREDAHFADLAGMEFAFPHDDCPCVLELQKKLEEHCVAHGQMQYFGAASLVVERLLRGQAATILPYSTAQRYRKIYGLDVIRLDEEDLWMNVRIVYRRFEGLTAGGRALVAHSQQYARKLIENDPKHFLPPETTE